MKKIILWPTGIIIFLLIVILGVLFTPIGNTFIKNIIQAQIDKYAPIKFDVKTFSLRFSNIDVLITHRDKIFITLGGNFSLFSQTLDLALRVDAQDIAVLGELVDTPLQGSFTINSVAKGRLNNLEINTTSDIAKSFSDIRILLQNYIPTSIIVQIKDAQIKEILAMIGKKPYVSGMLNIQADVKGSANMNFNGNALMSIAQGLVDSTLIKKDFGIEVPKTTFLMTLNALFDMDKINHDLNFHSNIGNIHSSGQSLIKDTATHTQYSVNLNDLSAFTPLAGMPIRGELNTKGEIIGSMQSLLIKGDSDVAKSNTTYEANLERFMPKTIHTRIKNLSLDRLLWMIYVPTYANMKLNLESFMNDFDKNLSTQTSLAIFGISNNAVIKKELDIDIPNTKFSFQSNIEIMKGIGEANSTLDSDIAKLNLPKTKINLKNFAIEAPYEADISNLKKLKFITHAELRGDIKANGVIKLSDTLHADFHTQSLGGNIDALLHGNKLTASIQNINTLKLLNILQLPEVFYSNMNGNLFYDTLTEKGKLDAVISNGKLISNKVTELINKYLSKNITQEIYENMILNANIDKKVIQSDINLKSHNTSISAKGAMIDMDKEIIDANFKFQIKDKYLYIKAYNKLSSPTINIDAKDLIKAEANQAIKKEAKKAIDKYIKDDNLKDGAQKLLKNLFE